MINPLDLEKSHLDRCCRDALHFSSSIFSGLSHSCELLSTSHLCRLAARSCLCQQGRGYNDLSYTGLQVQGQPFIVALLQGDVGVEIQSPVFSAACYLLPVGEATLPALIRGIEMKTFAYRAWYTQCKTILWVLRIKHTTEEIILIKWVSKTSNKYTQNLQAHLRVCLGISGQIKIGRQFKLCHFLILGCLTLYSSSNIDVWCACLCTGDQHTWFASSEDYSLLGIIPWALRKELCVLQTSWIREGDKTSKYVQEIPRLRKLCQYTQRNQQTIATVLFCLIFFTTEVWKWRSFIRSHRLLWDDPESRSAVVSDWDASLRMPRPWIPSSLKNGPLLSFAKGSH